MSSSGSTTGDLHEFCENSSDGGRINFTRITKFSSEECKPRHRSRRCPDESYFASVIMPLSELDGFSRIGGCVEFKMRRKNKTVTLQWEPFSGVLTMNGVSHLTVAQCIPNTSPYTMTYPLYLKHRGISRISKLVVDPFVNTGNVMFYLYPDGSTIDTHVGDSISIDGGCISWIVD